MSTVLSQTQLLRLDLFQLTDLMVTWPITAAAYAKFQPQDKGYKVSKNRLITGLSFLWLGSWFGSVVITVTECVNPLPLDSFKSNYRIKLGSTWINWNKRSLLQFWVISAIWDKIYIYNIWNLKPISCLFELHSRDAFMPVLPEKLGGGVRPSSQILYPIYDQNLRHSLPYLWPDQKFETLFMTWLIKIKILFQTCVKLNP